MKFTNLRFALVILFIFILGLLALPQFQLKIAGKQFTYPNIDLGIINPGSNLGNFQKSFGIYATKEYTGEILFENLKNPTDQQKQDELNNLLGIVNKRLNYAYLYDVKAFGEIQNGVYYIKLDFPEYYADSDKLAGYIFGKGSITFSSYDDPTKSVNLYDYDIDGNISSFYDTANQVSVLSFKFKDNKLGDVLAALSSKNNLFVMQVDSSSVFAVVGNQNVPGLVEAIPYNDITDKKTQMTFVNIVRTYFMNDVLNDTISLKSQTPKVLPANYLAGSLSLIAVLFLDSAILLLIGSIIVFGKNFVKFGLMLSSYVLMIIVFLKFETANLSIGTIIGFIFAYIIGAIVIWHLLKTDEENVKNDLIRFRDLGIFLTIAIFLIYKLNLNLGVLVDFVGVMIIASIALVINVMFIFKNILFFTMPTKLPFKRSKK